jgi:hypothetical protein
VIEPKYAGEFKSRDDVAKAFHVGTGDLWSDDFTPAVDFPAETDILYASYESGGYEGWAFVLFTQGRTLFEVSGSHCSCFGLEGQWHPEETSWAAIAMRQPDQFGAPREVITEAKKRSTPMTDRGHTHESLDECLARLSAEIAELRAERVRMAAVLETFRQAPLSVSSVQPILALAEELNGAMVP